MPARTVFTASIESVSILDEHGRFDAQLGADLIPDEDVIKLYEAMTVSRQFDHIAFKLQRSGRMGTYPARLLQARRTTCWTTRMRTR